MSSTSKAVEQLRAYAKYIDQNAESIIGSIDAPTWVTDSGLRFSFTLADHETVPTLEVAKEYIVLDAIDVIHGGDAS